LKVYHLSTKRSVIYRLSQLVDVFHSLMLNNYRHSSRLFGFENCSDIIQASGNVSFRNVFLYCLGGSSIFSA